jgi:hypothetical protein
MGERSRRHPLWFRQIAAAGNSGSVVPAIVFDPFGDPLIAGFTFGPNSLVSGPLGGGADVMAAKLAP